VRRNLLRTGGKMNYTVYEITLPNDSMPHVVGYATEKYEAISIIRQSMQQYLEGFNKSIQKKKKKDDLDVTVEFTPKIDSPWSVRWYAKGEK
jgi:hypothetical protein